MAASFFLFLSLTFVTAIDPLTLAIVGKGVIGMTSLVVAHLKDQPSVPNRGGCSWVGEAPTCRGSCPSDHFTIREATGSFFSDGRPDPFFGYSYNVGKTKKFCCKADENDRSWGGRWMSAQTADNFMCGYQMEYVNKMGRQDGSRCGKLFCSHQMGDSFKSFVLPIVGKYCRTVEWKEQNITGTATYGMITWSDGDAWFKGSS